MDLYKRAKRNKLIAACGPEPQHGAPSTSSGMPPRCLPRYVIADAPASAFVASASGLRERGAG